MGITYAANVISVTKGKKGKNPYGSVFYGMDTSHEMKALLFYKSLKCRLYLHPEAYSFKNLRRQLEGKNSHQFLTGQRPFFITGDHLCYLEVAFSNHKLALWPAPIDPDDFGFFFAAGSREIFEI